MPRADEEQIGQIKQHEQDCEPADDSQDSYYHGILPPGMIGSLPAAAPGLPDRTLRLFYLAFIIP
jgi:hypothetical protein